VALNDPVHELSGFEANVRFAVEGAVRYANGNSVGAVFS
jgi:hypothetical protein